MAYGVMSMKIIMVKVKAVSMSKVLKTAKVEALLQGL